MKCKKLSFVMALYLGVPIITLMIITFVSMAWMQNLQALSAMEQQAKTIIQQVKMTEQWVSDHQGVWVKDDRGSYYKQQGEMYLMIPPNVLAELSAYSQSSANFTFRTTSLKPKNIANAPTTFEQEALRELEKGKKEVSGVVIEENKRIFHYMVPLYTTEECLKCHAKDGYKLGDIRGGLIVNLPYDQVFISLMQTRLIFIIGEIITFTVVISLLYLFFFQRVLKPLEQLKKTAYELGHSGLSARAEIYTGDEFEEVGNTFNDMAERLKQSYENLVMLTTDNRALHLKNMELNEIATTDGLTGLYNHRFFHDALDLELEQSRVQGDIFAVVMMDIDNFKLVNDTCGHVAGDIVLREVATVIKRNLRKGDLAARYGGEEFSLILPGASQQEAALVAERIRGEIELQKIKCQNGNIKVTISAGLAVYPEDAENKDGLLEDADNRLYTAKGKGKNRICISN